MRTILFCLLIILLSLSTIHSQIQPPGIPNRDFEYWTEGLPDNWYANNIDPSIITLTQTTDANSGESAAKMEVGSIFDTSVGPVLLSGHLINLALPYPRSTVP